MAFSFSTRAARTALASAAMLVLSLVAVPAAQAYNPDIDGDGIGNILEMRGMTATVMANWRLTTQAWAPTR